MLSGLLESASAIPGIFKPAPARRAPNRLWFNAHRAGSGIDRMDLLGTTLNFGEILCHF